MSKRKRLRLLIRHFQENGLKILLERFGNVRELLQVLDVQLLPRIDFMHMRVVPGRFVGRDYRHLESDLVLQAPIRPGTAGAGPRIPTFQPLFLNVGQTSPEALKKGGAFGLLLRLVQQRRARLPVFEETLREVVQVLDGLADQERERWLELLSYVAALIYNEREVPEQERLMEKVTDSVQNDAHRREVFDMGKTIAEHLVEKGRAEGLQEGRQEGRQQGEVKAQRRMLLRLLRNKFGKIPAALVKRIEATEGLNLLDAWFDQASAAETLDDVSCAAE